MPFKYIWMLLIFIVDGFQYYRSKLFTHEPLDKSVENDYGGIVFVGILISPLLLILLIKWIIEKISVYVKEHPNMVSTKVVNKKAIYSNDIRKSTPKSNGNGGKIFLIFCKCLFGVGIIAGVCLGAYMYFFYEPYDSFKEYQYKYIIPEGFVETVNDTEQNSPSNTNNAVSVPEIPYYSAPIYNNQYGNQQSQEVDNSGWVNYYTENYNRMAEFVESQYNSLMNLGSGIEYGDGHNGATDNFLGRSKYDLINNMHQTQREMQNLRVEVQQKYGINIPQSSWENATIN